MWHVVKSKRALVKLSLDQQLASNSTIARFVWDVSPEAGIAFSRGSDTSSTLLLEFAQAVHLPSFASSLTKHLRPFMAEGSSLGFMHIQNAKVWAACLFLLANGPSSRQPTALTAVHYPTETLRLHITRPAAATHKLWQQMHNFPCIVETCCSSTLPPPA